MTIQSLENTPFQVLLDCFLKAFEHYFVEMPQEAEYYQTRWKQAKVDFSYSYGMFDQGQLIGFIIHGIDRRDGLLTAYNTGTGVLPNYRSRKVVQHIYEYAKPLLKEKGIEKCLLEVITENTFALKAYKKIGFAITRTLKCYRGSIPSSTVQKGTCVEKELQHIDFEQLPNQQLCAWDHRSDSIQSHPHYRFFQVEKEGEACAFFIIHPQTGSVAQCDVLGNRPIYWKILFSAISTVCQKISINNVDTQLKEKVAFLHSLGLENTLDQYEMEWLF